MSDQTENELFAASETSPAEAFENLRKELALCRFAVGGLVTTVEKIPNYGPALINFQEVLEQNTGVVNDMGNRFDRNNNQLTAIARAPALELTADNWGEKIAEAGEYARRLDHAAFEKAVADLYKSMRGLADWTESARTRDQQNKWLYLTAMGTFFVTALFFVGLFFLFGVPPSRMEIPAATHQALGPTP